MMQGKKLVSGFLVLLLVMCFVMVTLGGYVRLSGSGLSIPEWPVFTIEKVLDEGGNVIEEKKSIFPPTSEEGWQTLYTTLVTELPQYEGIGMAPFKRMFWIEWSHRGLAKTIGVVYLAFLASVFFFKDMRSRIGWMAAGGLVLLVSQAVAGGIVVLFHLKAVKVSIHLLLAFFFTCLLLWMLLRLNHEPDQEVVAKKKLPAVYYWAFGVFLIICFQIFSGGLMAASLAGYQMNTWPKMGEHWVPPGMMVDGDSFFKSFTENIVMIQFFHRWFAIFTLLAVFVLVFRFMTVRVSPLARISLRLIAGVAVLQVILGILTLLNGVMPALALLHQSVGLVLMLNCLLVIYETKNHRVFTEAEIAQEKEAKALSSSNQEVAPSNA